MAVSVEQYFGLKAGIVWSALSIRGPLSIAQLKRETRLTDSELYSALGWLARESKISIVGDKPLFFKFQVQR